MKRVTVDMAAQATGLFDVHRFRQHTKKERESAWHAFRALGVGGSDMSTILGLNPYSTPYDLWLEKTNRQQPEDISGKWAIVKGNAWRSNCAAGSASCTRSTRSSTAPTFPWYPSSIR